jgi:hypothetical protein
MDEKTLLTNFEGTESSRVFTIGARLDQDWLTLTVIDGYPKPSPDRQQEVYRRLLELNARISIARFAIQPDSEIILTADLFAGSEVDYEVFATTLDALSFYADKTYSALEELIADEDQLEPEGTT